MSLESSVFENNQWVTRTIRPDDLFRARPAPEIAESSPAQEPPRFGLVTRTVIESPIIQWVLPVQIRSPSLNDVALVREQSVEICELGKDVQLRPIAKKVDFGVRIRNCRVLGPHEFTKEGKEGVHDNRHEDDIAMADSESPTSASGLIDTKLFQQILILVLDTGQLVFLYMTRNDEGSWQFVSYYFSIHSGTFVNPGFHIAMSPDGDYLALASQENTIIVYQLESMEELRRQVHEGQPIQPIRSFQARAMKGIIHKIEFLHPGSEDIDQITLIVITVKSGVFRLAIFDWDPSESFKQALAAEKFGHRLDETAGIPLLIIPLTVGCQFLMIAEHSMAICSDVLGGPPVFVPFELEHRDPTIRHHGSRAPMWTTWTRPMREGPFYAGTDMIYLAREDGWVNSLEIKGDSGIELSIYYDLQCNIDSSFASVFNSHGDILVAGGDHGPGGIWNLLPRRNPQRIGSLPNWSPAMDMLLKKDISRHTKPAHSKIPKKPRAQLPACSLAPEKMFTCIGRGASGAIAEMRYGIEAKIGLDLLYDLPIKRCWAVPSFDNTQVASFFLLLSLPGNSALLQISEDLAEVTEKSQETVDFDLLSPTLAVDIRKDLVIQITTTHATIVSPGSCYQHSIGDMIGGDPLSTVVDAAITDRTLALSISTDSQAVIKVFVLDTTRTGLTLWATHEVVGGYVTALSVITVSHATFVCAGLLHEKQVEVAIYPVDLPQSGVETGTHLGTESVVLESSQGIDPAMRAVSSIVSIDDGKIVMGMKNGDVYTLRYQPGAIRARKDSFGYSPCHVFPGMRFGTDSSTIVCSDAGLAIMKESNTEISGDIFHVWLTDANEPSMSHPIINSIASLHQIPDYGDNHLIMISGSRILFTELQSRPAPVPRYMSVGGTPLKMLYSERLDALVTIIVKSGIHSLHFVDPSTGADLSRPVTKRTTNRGVAQKYVDVNHITYLGKSNIKVVSLLNWQYKHKGYMYDWIVVITKVSDTQGRFLLVSTEEEEAVPETESPRRIRFWTQSNRKLSDGSPRVGATDDDGLLITYDKTLEYLTIADKKLYVATKYELPSPAMNIEAVDGKLQVLTSRHSLIVLDYKSENALKNQRMIQLYTDEIARNGLHSIDVTLGIPRDQQQECVTLTSDLMCGVYGLWMGPSSPHLNWPEFRLLFRAELTASIRKFVQGYTRPYWARSLKRKPSGPLAKHGDVLGLAMNGSVTQFRIVDERMWRVLRFVQDLALRSEEICLVPVCHIENNDDDDDYDELDPTYLKKTRMHIDGDVLKRCLDERALERIVSGSENLKRLLGLVNRVRLDVDGLEATDDAGVALGDVYAYLGDVLVSSL